MSLGSHWAPVARSPFRRLRLVLLAALLLPLAALSAQQPSRPELKALKFRLVGPYQGGRVSRVAGVPGDPRTYYLGSASGGVWKSTDGGVSWKPIFDDQPIGSIGSIAVAPSDPNVIYVGSGEANIRGNVQAGNGIYKSVDAGKTWTRVWSQEGQIGTMVVDPRNPDIAFAAVLGHAFGPNPERGVYRTRDGGKTWQQVLKKDPATGASDVALDPSNANVVFAGLWQARRRPWDLTSGGPGSGLYVSRDGGDTWKQLTGNGLPEGIWGKVGIAVAPSDGRRVYALIEAERGGLFRSDDGGDTWRLASPSRALRQRAWYYSTMAVNPSNPDDLWFPQVPLLHSIDGGKTILYAKGAHHGDHHDIWIDPQNPQRMIDGNDGGVDLTVDGGETWRAPRLPLGQFYHVSVDTRVPYRVAGAQQDIGTAQGPSNSLKRPGIGPGDWKDVGGGEAGWVVSDPADPNIVYAGEYLGIFTRYDDRSGQARNVTAYPENPSGHGIEDFKYRFQWTAPIATSPHDPKVVYHGANVVFKSSDGGQTWTVISPDLTRNDKSKQKWSGGPITGDNTGVEMYGTVFVIAESPAQKDLIWAGTDDGLVQVTRDGGKTWSNVTGAMPGSPEWGTVSMIEPSRLDPATAYVVVDAHRLDDMRPYLYKTTDGGRSWKRLDGRLPPDVYLHSVREDPTQRGILYLGTERGVMYSTDDGGSWQSLRLNLPTVAVHDLVVKDNDLVLATHGRSLWILDDLTPVRMLAQAMKADLYLFPPPETIAWRYGSGVRDRASGRNPPEGAQISYFLKAKPKAEITLEIRDAQGRLVRTLRSTRRPPDYSGDEDDEESEAGEEPKKADLATDPGVQRAVWDLRWEGARKIYQGKIDTGDPAKGPFAVPGTYSLTLNVDGRTATSALTLKADPRAGVPLPDLEQQLAFGLEIRDSISSLTDAVNQLRSIKDQLRARHAALAGNPAAVDLIAAGTALIATADSLEARLHNPTAEVVYDILAMRGGAKLYSRLSPLLLWATDGDGPPTQGMREVFADQKRELTGYRDELRQLIEHDLAAVNAMAGSLGVGYVVVPSAK